MFLQPFWVLNVLLSMKGHKVLRFHQKYINLCSDDKGLAGLEQHEVIINDNFFFFLVELALQITFLFSLTQTPQPS